jgi:hypothetical protein
MPPFDMICIGCTCTEYIPGGARATELEEASRERREAQRRPNQEGAGRRGQVVRRTGKGSYRGHACGDSDGSGVCRRDRTKFAGAGGAKAPGSVKARLAHRKYQEIGLCVTTGFP